MAATHGGKRRNAGRKPGKPNIILARGCGQCNTPMTRHRVCERCGVLVHEGEYMYCRRCVQDIVPYGLCQASGHCQAVASVRVGSKWVCAGCAERG